MSKALDEFSKPCMPKPSDLSPMSGCGVLATRPQGFNTGLIQALSNLGAEVSELPLLSIVSCPMPTESMLSCEERIDGFIFTSRNAVEHAFAHWPELAQRIGTADFSAVGAGTAKALKAKGIAQVLIPKSEYNSEGLLDLAQFRQPTGQHLAVISGHGGRGLLVDTLRARGAQVTRLDVYKRVPVSTDVRGYLRQHLQNIQMIVITSAEALAVLVDPGTEQDLEIVLGYPLVVASDRIARVAKTLGFSAQIEVAEQVTDKALADACQQLWAQFQQ